MQFPSSSLNCPREFQYVNKRHLDETQRNRISPERLRVGGETQKRALRVVTCFPLNADGCFSVGVRDESKRLGKFKMREGNEEGVGKCDVCLEIIPIEYYFSIGDEITGHECGTEYKILSKDPAKLTVLKACDDPDDYREELKFE